MDGIFGHYQPLLMIKDAITSERRRHMVKLLVSYGADLEMRDEDGHTALMSVMSVEEGSKFGRQKARRMSILLEFGANVNTTNAMGETPLILAVQQSLGYEITKLLLKYGANPALRDELGLTAKDYALTQEDYRTVELLEEWQSGQ
ncbi:ankyrin repeat [Trichoderma arundinaceum]|uniref:Ankyrin repeat n=1 Tax=Trichoderma arundinaceum TaxID=490622 RepID=A0A395NVJ6_TRIAR|nr:ankyrin repeat [Trichoderma arundinaceum]